LSVRDGAYRYTALDMTSGSQGGSPRATTPINTTDAASPSAAPAFARFSLCDFTARRRADAQKAAAATIKLSATQSLRLPSSPSHGTSMKPLANEPAIAPSVLAAYAS